MTVVEAVTRAVKRIVPQMYAALVTDSQSRAFVRELEGTGYTLVTRQRLAILETKERELEGAQLQLDALVIKTRGITT